MKNGYIGLIANDSPQLITGLLGILKSGNAFVPISPAYPLERIVFIVKDSGIIVLLSDRSNYEKVQQAANLCPSVQHLICIDDIGEEAPSGQGTLKSCASAGEPCYLIYTSGSTGQPKGVPITHENLIPLFSWFREYFQLGLSTRVMQNLSYVFDFGVFEILTTLIYGGRLYVLDKGSIGDFSFYSRFINRHLIDMVHSTPVFFSNVVALGERMPGLKTVHLGGERLTGKRIKEIARMVSPSCWIHNGYGPTEATINCSIYTLRAGKIHGLNEQDGIPIGRPTAWNILFIMDKSWNPQPVGAAGELCVCGAGLATGYLNRPELSREKFIATDKHGSFRITFNQKLLRGGEGGGFLEKNPPHRRRHYQTGDLTRWQVDGNIEFLGRIDFQVKIRGYRIELGEIEARLLKHPQIKDAVVIARENETGSYYLCAFYEIDIKNVTESLPVSQLREYLAADLPDYMIPAFFVALDRFPLTATGKVNRRKLPEPDKGMITAGMEYIPAVTETERVLVRIWQELLNIEKIGIMDDFFELGGDSILANQSIARIREVFRVELPLRKFFEQPFIKVLAGEIGKKEKRSIMIPRASREGIIPLSFAQERLWFLQELDAENTAYFVPRVIRMRGKLEKELFERTFTEIIRRHEILRTRFLSVDGVPQQCIDPPYDYNIPVIDQSNRPAHEQERVVHEWLQAEGRRKFNFETGPLLRVTLLKLKPEEYLLVLTEHHLIHDGWTQGVLLKEFIEIYSAYRLGKDHRLPELKIQYADFAIWQRQTMRGESLKSHLDYWQKKLEGKPQVLELPADRPRPAVISGEGDMIEFRLSPILTGRLEEFSRKNEVTLFMNMLALFKILLFRYSGEEDLCVGTGIANRSCKEMEGMLGMVINSLPLRTSLAGNPGLIQFLHRVKETCLEAYQHQDTPFGKIVEILQPERNLSYTPLFQVMFNFMDTPGSDLHLPDLEMHLEPSHNRTSKFDIHLVVVPPRGQDAVREILVEWEYNTDIFEEETMNRMIAHYVRLLESSIQSPGKSLTHLEMMTEHEAYRLLETFNDTAVDMPAGETIHGLFQEQAGKTPDRIAVTGNSEIFPCEYVQLTYDDVYRRSSSRALYLKRIGVRCGSLVAVCIARSMEMVTGIFAILLAGGAYIPVEPGFPEERIQYILKDSGTGLVIAPENMPAVQEDLNGDHLPHRDYWPVPGQVLAYIIYTSGSTGKPKGVAMNHAPVANVLKALNKYYPFGSRDTYLFKTPFIFDVSITELFGWFMGGGKLAILENGGEKNPQHILSLLAKEHVTHVNFVPSMFGAFIDILRDDIEILNRLTSLRYIFLAGEALPAYMVQEFRNLDSHINLENIYGPTEAAIYASRFSLAEWAGKGPVPIGRPIRNTHIYILAHSGILQPVNVPGELCIGGAGLARGYLNRPELTAEKFCQSNICLGSPGWDGESRLFNSLPLPLAHSVIYHTGDLARWLNDGNIEFLGRIDHQVKIRGYRIELGEIEAQLLRHGAVKEAVVSVPGDDLDRRICAYMVRSNNGSDVQKNSRSAEEFKSYLSRLLPGYMIPAYFVILGHMPLTPGGKVDRMALPNPMIKSSEVYTPPTDEVQKQLVEIWTQVLGIKDCLMGIDDNFFAMGGDSIKALQVAARLKKYNLNMSVNSLFKFQTVRALAKHVVKTSRKIPQDAVTGEVALTPIQEWFFDFYPENNHHFNQAVVVFREQGFDESQLKKVFEKIIIHHDALRMVYKKEGKRVVQVNRGIEGKLFHLEVTDLRHCPDSDIPAKFKKKAARIQGQIDLAEGPLVHLGLFKTMEGDHLLIAIHHLVIDGVSWRILLEDMGSALEQLHKGHKGEEIRLPDKTDSYGYWSGQLREYAQSRQLLAELDYWQKIEHTRVEPLPQDYEIEAAEKTFAQIQALEVSLDKPNTDLLLKGANRAFGTETVDLLLAALGKAIRKWSGNRTLLVHLEGHGREELGLDIDVSRTVGWFTSMYPVVLELDSEEIQPQSDARLIKYVKEQLRTIPHKGIGYHLLKYLTSREKLQGLEFKREPVLVFNYLGQFGRDSESGRNPVQLSRMSSNDVYHAKMKSYFSIDISVKIVEGSLGVSILYNKKEYNKTSIKNLLNYFRTGLVEIIQFCCLRKISEKTPSDMVFKGLTINALEDLQEKVYRGRKGVEIENIYPLTPMQSGILFHYLLNPSNPDYFEQCVIDLAGEVDREQLNNSFNSLARRHDVLRSLFCTEEGEQSVAIILNRVDFSLHYKDISSLSGDRQEEWFSRFRIKDLEKKFNLTAEIAMRATLFRLGKKSYRLLWSFHHILMDGWSLALVLKELMQLYRSLKGNRPLEMEPAGSLRKYLEWQLNRDKESHLDFWTHYLEGYRQEIFLPGANDSLSQGDEEKVDRGELDLLKLFMDEKLTGDLNRMAAEYRVTLNTIFQTAWGILLQRYNNCSDVVFGTVVSGRSPEIDRIEGIAGLLINTIPIRVERGDTKTFCHLLMKVQRETARMNSHDHLPLADVQCLTPLNNKLIDHIMAFENYAVDRELKENTKDSDNDFRIEQVRLYEQSHYNFNLIIVPGDTVMVKFSYDPSVYSKEQMTRIRWHFFELMDRIADNPSTRLDRLDIIPEPERKRILIDFNGENSLFPRDETIFQLFCRQVEKSPDHTVLAMDRQGLAPGEMTLAGHRPHYITYKELESKAVALALLLHRKGTAPGMIVGVKVEPSLETVAAILGILAAGAAYMPLNPGFPRERIDFMVRDSSSSLVITAEMMTGLSQDVNERGMISGAIDSHLAICSGTLAYLMYTSGSTGRPKGVMVEHSSVIRLVKNTGYLDFDEHHRILQTGGMDFDASTFEIWGILLNRGHLVLANKENILTPAGLGELLWAHLITTLWLTAPLFNRLLGEDKGIFSHLGYLLVGGDKLNPETINRARNRYPSLKIINGYGPTENTTFSTTYLIDREFTHRIPIGKPIANSTAYIVDRVFRLQPIGAPGELMVGGDGVARGYLNNPELSAQKFICPDRMRNNITKFYSNLPANSLYHSAIYRTGDLARWLADGNIDFLGRMDRQVKIRGFRLEPAEIETQLLNNRSVSQAVVLPGEDNSSDKYICAYIVLTSEGKQAGITGAILRQYLESKLPPYMMPGYFVLLENIPLTSNGKIDREALPSPETGKIGYTDTQPRDELEHRLAEIWSEVLAIDKTAIGIDSDFFHLGGHSLKATLLISRIHKYLNVKIPLTEFFSNPFIRSQARYVRAAGKELYRGILPGEKKEYYPLSSPQERLFVLEQVTPGTIAYNLPQVFAVKKELEMEELEQAIGKLIHRHGSLRTSFFMKDGAPVQRIRDQVPFEICHYDLTLELEVPQTQSSLSEHSSDVRSQKNSIHYVSDHSSLSQNLLVDSLKLTSNIIKNFVRPFKLSVAPLLRLGLIDLPEHRQILMVDMHHIITDGTSQGILMDELTAVYSSKIHLSTLRLDYSDYAQWLRGKAQEKAIRQQASFWLDLYKDGGNILEIPHDFPRPSIQRFEGSRRDFKINRAKTAAVKKLAAKEGATLYMVMLALFNVFLFKISGKEDVTVGTPVAGRRLADLKPIVGMFVNTLALRNYPVPGFTFKHFLYRLKENTLQALENQEYPFEDLVQQLELVRDTGRNPLFDVAFSFHPKPAGFFFKGEEKILAPYPYDSKVAKFDLTLVVVENENNITAGLEYSTSLFKSETIQRYIEFFQMILKKVLSDPVVQLAQIEIISPQEKRQILMEFNNTRRELSRQKDLCQLAAEQVVRTPDYIALVGHGLRERTEGTGLISVTYRELAEQSLTLAGYLQELGVKPERIVAVMLERSLEMVMALLAILKTRAAYLPVNPEYPEPRKKYLLSDSGVDVVISPGTFFKYSRESGSSSRSLSEAGDQGYPATNKAAYITYTSGSTGKPKGVIIEHCSVARLVCNTGYVDNYVEFHPGLRLLQSGALEFDASTFEIWGALLNGLSLYLFKNARLLAADSLKKTIIRYGINMMWMTSPLFNRMVQVDIEIFAGLSVLLVGGDVLAPVQINRFLDRFPEIKLINGYGPTENTTFSTTFPIEEKYADNIPIGKPIAGSTAYIIDKNGNFQPIGIPGELLVGGEGVARGYLNNPESTAENFLVLNGPENTKGNYKNFLRGVQGTPRRGGPIKRFIEKSPLISGRQRLYKTGDLACWLPDGNILFLGRIDQQVKIRGFRVEPGEIESSLLAHERIKEVVVLARADDSGEKYLTAYLVFHTPWVSQQGNTSEIREYLTDRYPDYMVPAYFLSLENIPLTLSGKVDHRALPVPGQARPQLTVSYLEPQTETGIMIAHLWKEVLGIDKIGILDNFFELGGNSLKLVQMHARLNQILGIEIALVDLFRYTNIDSLVKYLNRGKKELPSNHGSRSQKISKGKDKLKVLRNKKQVPIKE